MFHVKSPSNVQCLSYDFQQLLFSTLALAIELGLHPTLLVLRCHVVPVIIRPCRRQTSRILLADFPFRTSMLQAPKISTLRYVARIAVPVSRYFSIECWVTGGRVAYDFPNIPNRSATKKENLLKTYLLVVLAPTVPLYFLKLVPSNAYVSYIVNNTAPPLLVLRHDHHARVTITDW